MGRRDVNTEIKYEGPISIEEDELPQLIELLNLVFRPNGGDMGMDYPRHVGKNNLANIRVIKQNGKIVSHVATSVRPVLLGGIPTKVAGIGAVATHPDGRGQGLASILMDDAVSRSVQQGADIMLISGDLGLYRRMNAVDCGSFSEVRIKKSELAPFSEMVKDLIIDEVIEQDIDRITSLRSTLSTRYLLPREDMAALLKCKMVMDKPSDWWMIRNYEEAVGFGVIHCKGKDLFLLDWVGRPSVLNGATGVWFEIYEADTLTYVPVLPSFVPLAWRGFIQRERYFDGTVLVIDAKRFLNRAMDYLAERIGEEKLAKLKIKASGQYVRFKLGKDEVEFVNGGELARFFFGEPNAIILSERLSAETELYQLLSHAFPVPLVWYGIGYV
ncbi:MAG: GNAT family N-acetyltransferase [Candidatus Omnitrophota bacterium]|jgi:predicted N-acetyltransferase YhbS|nr:MAG: GNAT family N-acetyltransferase [Candidatus Omnitrophota bacterium]